MKKTSESTISSFLERARNLVESELSEYVGLTEEYHIKLLDNYLDDPAPSNLEKAFFVLLNRFPDARRGYFVVPNERVRVPNVYGPPDPFFDYELDFAAYSGSVGHPVRIAVECDGIRSHRQRHSDRDRRKDVNLQAAGWIVMRFGSAEIHEELQAMASGQQAQSKFVETIENVISSVSDALTPMRYVAPEIRSMLTGLPWGQVSCTACGWSQQDVTDRPRPCRKCGEQIEPPREKLKRA